MGSFSRKSDPPASPVSPRLCVNLSPQLLRCCPSSTNQWGQATRVCRAYSVDRSVPCRKDLLSSGLLSIIWKENKAVAYCTLWIPSWVTWSFGVLSRSDKGKIGMQAADCFFAGTKDGVERRGSKLENVFCLLSLLWPFKLHVLQNNGPSLVTPSGGTWPLFLGHRGNRKHVSLQHDTSPASLAWTQLCSSSFECTVYCLFLNWPAFPGLLYLIVKTVCLCLNIPLFFSL